MTLWYRVFGRTEAPPEPGAVREYLQKLGIAVESQLTGDADGWLQADFMLADGETLHVERFLASEEGIRSELNSWAAWVETCEQSPHHVSLMERIIQTAQLFTLEPSGGPAMEALSLALCRHLAQQTDGIYQVDGEGLFTAEGTLLVREAS
jgi:hypothetical protein